MVFIFISIFLFRSFYVSMGLHHLYSTVGYLHLAYFFYCCHLYLSPMDDTTQDCLTNSDYFFDSMLVSYPLVEVIQIRAFSLSQYFKTLIIFLLLAWSLSRIIFRFCLFLLCPSALDSFFDQFSKVLYLLSTASLMLGHFYLLLQEILLYKEHFFFVS